MSKKIYVKKIINNVLDKTKLDDQKKETILKQIFSLANYGELYKFYSANLLKDTFLKLKTKFQLEDSILQLIIEDLIDKENDGYKYISLADEADFVQRDALYFGTVKLDISPRHLYGNVSVYEPKFSISEEKLIGSNLNYISERFYNNPESIWFSRIYEKILAHLIIGKNFKMEWLEKYNDEKFKRLITEGLDESNKRISLPARWISKAKDLFEHKIIFSQVLNLEGICFSEDKDIIDIEYDLINKSPTLTGLLEYPFEDGLLFDISYINKYDLPIMPKNRAYNINVFQDNNKCDLNLLLNFIKNISYYLPIYNTKNICEALANKISWTKRTRSANGAVTDAIV
jgi:hypothetical protein